MVSVPGHDYERGEHATTLCNNTELIYKQSMMNCSGATDEFCQAMDNGALLPKDDCDSAIHTLAERMYNEGRSHEFLSEWFKPSRRRWQRILASQDEIPLWKAVERVGDVRWQDASEETPDEEFKGHFESLLNPCDDDCLNFCFL